MLTDLHVHLRPDDAESTAEDHFTDRNAARYLDAARARGIGYLGISEHIHRFRQALDVWRHPFWVEQATDDLDAYVDFLAGTELRVGIEADYVAGAEDRIAELLSDRPFDYVIGSVHFVGEASIDQERWDVWEAADNDADIVWTRYFDQLAAAASSGLYDVLAHPDLVKVWGGERPDPSELDRFYVPMVEAVAEADVAVEVSTAGLRKPVGEIYPSRRLLELCHQAGVAFTLSSDAHVPEDLGHAYDQAVELMRDVGIEEICVFEGRERRSVPLG